MYKITWKNGTFLRSEHLQYRDDCVTAEINHRICVIDDTAWGLELIRVNLLALANNEIEITECKAVLKDGTIISYPGNCEITGIHIADELEKKEKLSVYLCPGIVDPSIRRGQSESEVRHKENTYYSTPGIIEKVYDRFDLRQSSDIELLTYRFHLALKSYNQNTNQLGLKLFEVEKSGDGLAISKNYIPPLLNIQVSEILKSKINLILDNLETVVQRGISFDNENPDPDKSVFAHESMLQGIVVKYICLLKVMVNSPCHPKNIWTWAFEFCCEYASLTNLRLYNDVNFSSLKYEHKDINLSVSRVFSQIMSLTQASSPRRKILANFMRNDGYFSLDLNSNWFKYKKLYLKLIFSGYVDAGGVLTNLKVASSSMMPVIRSGYLQGLSLEQVGGNRVTPGRKQSAYVFRIYATGKQWKSVLDEGNLVVYMDDIETCVAVALVGENV